MQSDLKGKVVLVTGAGSGLGEATARAFAEAGCAVACLDLNRAGVERVCRELGERDVPCLALSCDVSDAEAVFRSVDRVVDWLGRLDVVVNNAAVDHTVSIAEMTVEQWDQVQAVNLRGPFLWAKAAPYHASKWGLVGFSRGLGVEGRPYGIRVTTIIPGGMRTHFFDRFVAQGIPLPDESNLQDPANVAETIVFAVQMPAGSAIQELIVTPLTETSWP